MSCIAGSQAAAVQAGEDDARERGGAAWTPHNRYAIAYRPAGGSVHPRHGVADLFATLTPEEPLIEIGKARVPFGPQQPHRFVAKRTFGKPQWWLPWWIV